MHTTERQLGGGGQGGCAPPPPLLPSHAVVKDHSTLIEQFMKQIRTVLGAESDYVV